MKKLTLIAAAALAASAAHAARPLTTDDAGVLGRGECEWELVAARPSGGGHGWSTTGTCGIAAGVQLIGTYGRSSESGSTTQGFAPSLKASIADGGDQGISWTGSATLNALKEPGTGWRTDSVALNLIASRPVGAGFTVHANLGHLNSRPASQAATTWNLALERSGASGIDLMAEAFGDDRSSAPWLSAGVRWTLAPSFSLNAAWARQGGAAAARLFTFGLKASF